MNITAPASDDILILEASGAESLLIPGGEWLLKAEFEHQGYDLLLIGECGQKVLIPNYFQSDSAPDLVTASGAKISAELTAKLAGQTRRPSSSRPNRRRRNPLAASRPSMVAPKSPIPMAPNPFCCPAPRCLPVMLSKPGPMGPSAWFWPMIVRFPWPMMAASSWMNWFMTRAVNRATR